MAKISLVKGGLKVSGKSKKFGVKKGTKVVSGPVSKATNTSTNISATNPDTGIAGTPIISTAQGQRLLNENDQKIARFEGIDQNTAREQLAAIKQRAEELKAERDGKQIEQATDSMTFVNPETGQESTLTGAALTEEAKKRFQDQGYEVLNASMSQEQKTPEIIAAEKEFQSAENELASVTNKFEELAITNPELQSQLRAIRGVYDDRIARMEDVNERRQAAIRTLGTRIGARYTGGLAGSLGSILSEEERQGISRISAIENEMRTEIEAAKSAARDFNYTLYNELVKSAETKFNERQQALDDLKTAQQEQEALLAEEEEKLLYQSSIIEQISSGMTDPVQIFTALGGTVPFDAIKEITDTMPEASNEQFTLGRYDIRYDAQGNVIARGASAGGGGVAGDIDAQVSTIVPIGSPTVEGLGSSYEKSGFEAQMLIDDILNKIPVQLRNTEKEVELKKEQIRKQLAAGYSYQDIVDRLSGFSLQGENVDRDLGNALYNASLGTDMDMGQLASMINRGAYEQAMTTVENKQLSSVDAFFASTDKARSTVKQAQVVLDLLNDPTFPKDALGAFDGRQFKVEKFFGVNDTQRAKIQQLESALQLLASPIRVEVAGTAATESEMQKIAAFQSDILDQPDTIQTQVQELRDSVIRFHNEARSQRGLPQVDADKLNSNKKRLDLYRSLTKNEKASSFSTASNSELLGTSSSGFVDPNGIYTSPSVQQLPGLMSTF